MNHFQARDGILYAEDVALTDIVQQIGTPCYVYSRATLERHWHAFDNVFSAHDHLVCYAVKANSSLGVLNLLARLGSGFDIVSQGELERVIRAGGDPAKTVFSGVGKTADEMRRALEVGIYSFNVESEQELLLLNAVSEEVGRQAPVSIRVNPDVDAQTHPYIATGLKENKFGIDVEHALDVYRQAQNLSHIEVKGLDCHIGSQLCSITPFTDAIVRVLLLVDRLEAEGIQLQHIDLGGGLGITYDDEQPPEPAAYAQAIVSALGKRKIKILIEPGRAIAGNAGVLLTTVQYLKSNDEKNFAIVDAGMNDLLRPALYQAWQSIETVVEGSDAEPKCYDIVGPVCETGDFLGKDRHLALSQGSLLAVRSAGAYGFSMSSNYNSRPRAAEVMVDQDRFYVIRARERYQDLMLGETCLPG